VPAVLNGPILGFATSLPFRETFNLQIPTTGTLVLTFTFSPRPKRTAWLLLLFRRTVLSLADTRTRDARHGGKRLVRHRRHGGAETEKKRLLGGHKSRTKSRDSETHWTPSLFSLRRQAGVTHRKRSGST
jgi:hypothetical protein